MKRIGLKAAKWRSGLSRRPPPPPFRDEAETGKHGSAAASEAKMGTVYLRLLDDRARSRVSFHVAMDARVVGVAPYRVQRLSGLSGG